MKLLAAGVIALAGVAVAVWATSGSQVVRANSFVVEDSDGEIIAGLTSGWRPGNFRHPTPETYEGSHASPSLFLRQDSLTVNVSVTKYGASLTLSHKAGPKADVTVDSRGSSVHIETGNASVLLVAATGDQEAEVHVRSPGLKYDHHKVAFDIEALQGHVRKIYGLGGNQ